MAHELDFTTGLPAIAYTGETPWHGYGQKMDEGMSLEEWRTAAGLDWEVHKRPLWYNPMGRDFHLKTFPNRVALVRSDNSFPLSVVSENRYNVVQPKEVLEFFRALIDKAGFKMSTAGSLKEGRRVWALAECDRSIELTGDDKVDAFLLLATAYDGTFSTTAKFTSIRTVCNNTLEFGLNSEGKGGEIKIPHSQEFNPLDVRTELGFETAWGDFRTNILKLAEHKVTEEQAIKFFLNLLGVTQDEAADGKQLANTKRLLAAYESGPGAESAHGTAWGLVNATTFVTDHCRRSKNNGTRFDSAAFGSGAAFKRKAFGDALALVEAA